MRAKPLLQIGYRVNHPAVTRGTDRSMDLNLCRLNKHNLKILKPKLATLLAELRDANPQWDRMSGHDEVSIQ